jgi:GDP-mannose transporter
MLASMMMNLVNKQVAVTFQATSLLIVLQMLFAAATFLVVEWRNMKCGKWVDLAKWAIVPVFFAGMLITSVWSMTELSLSAVLILRNMLPVITFVAEKMLYDSPKQVSRSMLLSMLVALTGTVIYGCRSAAVTHRGILFIVMNCLITVADRLLQRHFLQSQDFSMSLPLCMVVNNIVGSLLTLGLAAASGEMSMWHRMAWQTTASSWSLVLFSCICGCCLGYLGLRCQALVSATTFLMLQNLSKVGLIFLSMCVFGDSIKAASAIGCLLSMAGALCYAYERLPSETNEKALCNEKALDATILEAEKLLKLKKQYGAP